MAIHFSSVIDRTRYPSSSFLVMCSNRFSVYKERSGFIEICFCTRIAFHVRCNAPPSLPFPFFYFSNHQHPSASMYRPPVLASFLSFLPDFPDSPVSHSTLLLSISSHAIPCLAHIPGLVWPGPDAVFRENLLLFSIFSHSHSRPSLPSSFVPVSLFFSSFRIRISPRFFWCFSISLRAPTGT